MNDIWDRVITALTWIGVLIYGVAWITAIALSVMALGVE